MYDRNLSDISPEDAAAGSRAQRPAELALSKKMLTKMHPGHFGTMAILKNMELLAHRKEFKAAKEHIAYRLQNGLLEPAVVVCLQPVLVAVHCTELDSVALLEFDSSYVSRFGLEFGRHLVAACTFSSIDDGIAPDMVLGPKSRGVWGNFHPLIGEFLCSSEGELKAAHAKIDGAEWDSVTERGVEYMSNYPGVSRDGTALNAGEARSSI